MQLMLTSCPRGFFSRFPGKFFRSSRYYCEGPRSMSLLCMCYRRSLDVPGIRCSNRKLRWPCRSQPGCYDGLSKSGSGGRFSSYIMYMVCSTLSLNRLRQEPFVPGFLRWPRILLLYAACHDDLGKSCDLRGDSKSLRSTM